MNNLSTSFRVTITVCLILVGIVFASGVHIGDSALDMLPDKAVRGDLKLLQELGMVDRVFITLSIDQPDSEAADIALQKLITSADKVGKFLADSGQFDSLLYKLPHGYETSLFTTLQPHLPRLLDQEDLHTVEQLITDKSIKEAMQHNFSLLNSLAGIGLKKQIQRDPLGLTTILLKKLVHLKSSFSINLRDGYFISQDGKNLLLIAISHLSLTEGNSAIAIQHTLDSAFQQGLPPGVTPRIIGTLPHTLANMTSIRHDLRTLIPIATILLLLLLLVTLRSAKAFLVLAIPFLAAPAAIGITSFIYGQIGGLALGFGIVLLGIAVDFSIHLYLALRYETGSPKQVLQQITKPILLAALTTTAVFLVLHFSQVVSHRQMATLALVGIILALLFSYLIIPLIVTNTQKQTAPEWFKLDVGRPFQLPFGKILLCLWILFIVAGTVSWNGLSYKGDLRVLDVPDQSVIDNEKYFRKTWEQKGEQGFLVAQGQTFNDALNNNSIIYSTLKSQYKLPFQSIGPILPSRSVQEKQLAAWRGFWKKNRDSFQKRFSPIASHQGFTPNAFVPFFSWIDSETPLLTPGKLLNSPLQPFVRSMVRKIEGSEHSDQSPHYLILTTVDTTGGLKPPLLELDKKEGITLISNFKWRDQVETLLRQDILLLSFTCGCIILLITVITFRKPQTVIAVLAPVISALSSMALFSYFQGAELNMMHLLMGIMVIGLSVDYGIFIITSTTNQTSRVSFMAVSICAASSLIGFGVLSFAHHPALQSLGRTVLMGIGAAWPTAIWISPLILSTQSIAKLADKK